MPVLLAEFSLSPLFDFFAFDMSKAIEVNMLVRYAIQMVLLGGSAFFSGSETALFSLSHVDFQQLRRSRHRHAETLQALLDEPRRLIVSILCGNELVNIAAIANMTGIFVALYGEAKAGCVYRMDGRLPIHEVNDALGLDLPATEFHTIGGMVVARLHHLGKQGESVSDGGYRFTVEEATDRTVLKVRAERDVFG